MAGAEPSKPAAQLSPPAGFYRFQLGDFTVVPLHDGVISRDRPDGFVLNASPAEVGEAFAAAGMPADKLTITFTPLAVCTPAGVVLIDTGFGEAGPPGTGRMRGNMAAAGLRPEDVTTVIISHFHGDHIAGLLNADGGVAFPNAEVLVPGAEWRFWMDEGNMSRAPASAQGNFATAQKMFAPLASRVRPYEWGEEAHPGFTAADASGHTPGMAALEIASGGRNMMFVADITNNPLVFARHPEWQAAFDMDPARTVATRRRLLDRAAADRLRLAFFHAPFPASGYVVKSGSGYEYLPALWTSD
jgi:glyoxylase-like metal-dependent hydrolase (beta-lactamase superfamily II)